MEDLVDSSLFYELLQNANYNLHVVIYHNDEDNEKVYFLIQFESNTRTQG